MIHKTAIISASAKIGKHVTIGPYCEIGDEVTVGVGVGVFVAVDVGVTLIVGVGVGDLVGVGVAVAVLVGVGVGAGVAPVQHLDSSSSNRSVIPFRSNAADTLCITVDILAILLSSSSSYIICIY